jgi:hypothetical protein
VQGLVHHQVHHHQMHHHVPEVKGHETAQLAAFGLGVAAAFGPVGLVVYGGAGATLLGAAWLIRRSREKA